MNVAHLLDVCLTLLGIYYFVDMACNALDRWKQKRELSAAMARWVANAEQQQRLDEEREAEIRRRCVAATARRLRKP